MSPSGDQIISRKKLLASQTNSTHKHSQLGSQITEPISAWKVYFRSPPGESYAHILQSALVFRIALKAERIFVIARFLTREGQGELP